MWSLICLCLCVWDWFRIDQLLFLHFAEGAVVGDRILNRDELDEAANLPSISEMHANVSHTLTAPARDILRILGANQQVTNSISWRCLAHGLNYHIIWSFESLDFLCDHSRTYTYMKISPVTRPLTLLKDIYSMGRLDVMNLYSFFCIGW